MPAFETMFKELIYAMRDEAALAQAGAMITEGADLTQILGALGVLTNAAHGDFIATTPQSMQAAILAAVGQNLSRATPKQMMFMWTPGYDWELRITESQSSVMSDGGITIHVKSRYPGDPHPGTGV